MVLYRGGARLGSEEAQSVGPRWVALPGERYNLKKEQNMNAESRIVCWSGRPLCYRGMSNNPRHIIPKKRIKCSLASNIMY